MLKYPWKINYIHPDMLPPLKQGEKKLEDQFENEDTNKELYKTDFESNSIINGVI